MKLNQKIKELSPKAMIILALIFVLSIANLIYPIFRFSFSLLNQIFLLLICLVPLVLVMNLSTLKKKVVRIIARIILLPTIAIFFIIGLFTAFNMLSTIHLGFDASFKQIERIKMQDSQVSVYLTDGGATTDYGIVIRQEKYILPGIILVKHLYGAYHRSDVEYEIIDEDTVKIDVMHMKSVVDEERFDLKKFVYF